jgi:hypothetical protein
MMQKWMLIVVPCAGMTLDVYIGCERSVSLMMLQPGLRCAGCGTTQATHQITTIVGEVGAKVAGANLELAKQSSRIEVELKS